MFKKLFNKPKEQEKQSARDKHVPEAHPQDDDDFPERPFDIKLDELYEYEYEDLHEFINQYEDFIEELRNKYSELQNGFYMAREKLHLMDQERKRLATENEQYKVHVENLKRVIDEKSTPTHNKVETPTTKSSSPKKLEELSQGSIDLDQNEDGIIEKLRIRGEKLISELQKAEEPLCASIMTLVSNKGPLGHSQEDNEPATTEENHQSEGSDHGRALDTDNDRALDSERVDNDKRPGKGSGEDIEGVLREAVTESLGNALKRIGNEFRNILDGYGESYGKTKLREKEIVNRMRNEMVSKSKSEEYEQELNDLKEKLSETKSTLNRTKGELEEKNKVIATMKKQLEETVAIVNDERKQFKEAVEEGQAENEALQENIEELKQALDKNERIIQELEGERDHLQERVKLLEKEYQNLSKDKEKTEKDVKQEILRHQNSLKELAEEKNKLEKKLTNSGNDKMDIENSLIQEKLKHHQTLADLAKLKERLEETEKNLNDEIEARKGDILKNDALKKRVMEVEKKGKEYKKTIKNLSQQILDLHNKRAKENEEKMKNEINKAYLEQDVPVEREETDHTSTQEAAPSGRGELITNQYEKIQMLAERVESLQKEVQALQMRNEHLHKDNTELNSQVKVLKEKRELGLQEIKRLNSALDHFKTTGGSQGSQSSVNLSSPHKKNSGYFSPITINSPSSANNIATIPNAEDLKSLRKIKKGMDEVYKDIILSITNEQIQESRGDRKATGKFGELVKGPLPSENFMKIEKKMNDTIVLFQEFMENFE